MQAPDLLLWSPYNLLVAETFFQGRVWGEEEEMALKPFVPLL